MVSTPITASIICSNHIFSTSELPILLSRSRQQQNTSQTLKWGLTCHKDYNQRHLSNSMGTEAFNLSHSWHYSLIGAVHHPICGGGTTPSTIKSEIGNWGCGISREDTSGIQQSYWQISGSGGWPSGVCARDFSFEAVEASSNGSFGPVDVVWVNSQKAESCH